MKIIAHRGASGYAPGNTLGAFALALKMGSKAFEFDVHRTGDGRLVVCHDYELKGPSGSALKIASTDYAGLKKYLEIGRVGNIIFEAEILKILFTAVI